MALSAALADAGGLAAWQMQYRERLEAAQVALSEDGGTGAAEALKRIRVEKSDVLPAVAWSEVAEPLDGGGFVKRSDASAFSDAVCYPKFTKLTGHFADFGCISGLSCP